MKLRSVFLLYRIHSAMAGNRLIYFLTRAKLLNQVFTDKLYAVEDGKLALSMLVSIYRCVAALAGKGIYLAVSWLLPLAMADVELFSPAAFTWSVWIFFWLSFGVGAMAQPISVQPSQMKYMCVRQMGMEAGEYQLTEIFTSHLAAFAGFTPFLLLWGGLTGAGVWRGLLLSLALAGVRLVAEWFHLWLYARFHQVPSGKLAYTISLIVTGLTLAYVPLMLGVELRLDTWLLHPAVVALLMVLGGVCARAVARYPHHYPLILATCQGEKVAGQQDAVKQANRAQFDKVKLQDSDLDTGADFSQLHGWRYLQRVFFHRHRRLLLKPFYIVLAILGAVTVAGCGAILILGRDVARPVFDQVTRFLPFCVFMLYAVDNTVGERICKAMFYNCDLALLRYGWYRERGAILKNFFLRWRMLCGVNLLVSGAACVMFLLFVLVSGGRPPVGEFILFLLAILSLGVFFATHSLAMYYIFQPYTAELDTKNPMFKILNFLMYVVCYLPLQIKSTLTWFALLVFVVTVGYSAVMLALVLRRAPKTFRVK